MGAANSSRKDSFDAQGEVNFDHFQILRAIGKGSFGKVCIVQKKDSKKMYAMKYMNKSMCIKKDAVRNVFREVEILMALDHPFLVNLWFTFQDEEDMFVVVDLLLGGDLRYHIQKEVHFDESHVKLYICELALALDYLQTYNIIHRDIKPDNILLDEEGHVHITDFNIATVLSDGQLATSMSGTTPYMAPEVFACAMDECTGYSFAVDWWSLGICAYEMLKGRRPYEIHNSTSIHEVKQMFTGFKIHFNSIWTDGLKDILKQLLYLDPNKRVSSLEMLKKHSYVCDVDFSKVMSREIKPSFVPSKDHLNCDPTYELEEMIIESKPLHKKKKRLAKQNSRRSESGCSTEGDTQDGEEEIYKYFPIYNRERDIMTIMRMNIGEDTSKVEINSCFDGEGESQITPVQDSLVEEEEEEEEENDITDDEGPPPSLANYGLSPRNSDGFGCSFVSSNLPASDKREVYRGVRARSLDYYHGPVPRRDMGRKYSHQPTSSS
ncbi:serine/threonine-protein kinase 32B-like isoform X1 [Mizuhopecten yessoensis]|uniref:serine/threonine-protein kinase 32B-like isoform X1 n=1 Tax=Mizuhopecten yessoensis TaxID=6573 RepID=UPI000B45D9CF|nr:serine/threonine-protein kinase 32B-like isoform X1 [Mizuhopecten yessoensis]